MHLTIRAVFIFVLFVVATCITTKPRKQFELFYRPPGTVVETYKTDPVALGINVYPAPKRPVGAVIFVHGGGWQMSGTDMPLFDDWEQPLDEAGIRAFSIEHRTAPEYRGRELVQDCIDAVNYVHANAARFKIPPEKIALIGFSSGGHLSVMSAIAMTRYDPNLPLQNASYLKAVVAFYAPLDLRSLVQSGSPEIKTILADYLPLSPDATGARDRNLLQQPTLDPFLQRALYDISPADNIHPYMPPTLLIHGDHDMLVPIWQSVAFYQRALQTGAPVAFIGVPGADHNFNQSRRDFARNAERTAIQFILSKLQ